jgi:serine protease Do
MWLRQPVVALVALCLGGCAGAERTVSALVPDQFRGFAVLGLGPVQHSQATERAVAPRPKPVKAAKPEPEPALVRAAAPVLPAWSIPAPKPRQVLRHSLSPSELFRKLSPSVYTVAVVGQAARSQGSAVAISAREAITNCHVVAPGGAITLINGAATLKAEVAGADLAADRCYLRALDGELQPVPGFRDYASLVVGETVYTIGSPKGLLNTLGSGLLSGLRTSEDEIAYIQITAPVSAGSSGGGLFDDRGNLIGVTTFTIKDSQNLNFAIAASQFWK